MGAESLLEREIVKLCKAKGIYTRKFSSPSHSGVPDRIFIRKNGNVLFLEIKAKGKKPTGLQYEELQQLTDRDIPATWVDCMADVHGLFDMWMRWDADKFVAECQFRNSDSI